MFIGCFKGCSVHSIKRSLSRRLQFERWTGWTNGMCSMLYYVKIFLCVSIPIALASSERVLKHSKLLYSFWSLCMHTHTHTHSRSHTLTASPSDDSWRPPWCWWATEWAGGGWEGSHHPWTPSCPRRQCCKLHYLPSHAGGATDDETISTVCQWFWWSKGLHGKIYNQCKLRFIFSRFTRTVCICIASTVYWPKLKQYPSYCLLRQTYIHVYVYHKSRIFHV